VKLERLDSYEKLSENVGAVSNGGIILAADDLDTHEFFLLTVDKGGDTPVVIGICSLGIGLEPVIKRRETTVWVGYNLSVAAIDVRRRALLWDLEIGSPIYDLIVEPASNDCIVIGEIAIVRLDENGAEVWRHDTQIVTRHEIDENELRVEFDESPPVRIDRASGRIVEWAR
jgi:hypothetical protein